MLALVSKDSDTSESSMSVISSECVRMWYKQFESVNSLIVRLIWEWELGEHGIGVNQVSLVNMLLGLYFLVLIRDCCCIFVDQK